MTAFDVDIMTGKRPGVFHAGMTDDIGRPEIPAFAGMSGEGASVARRGRIRA